DGEAVGRHAQLFERDLDGAVVEDAQHGLFTVRGGQRAHAQVELASVDHGADAAVLGQAPLGNIEVGHDLEAGDDGRVQVVRRVHLLEQHAVDPVPHHELLFLRFDVDVAGAL